MRLKQINQAGIEFYIKESTGEAFFSISSYHRFSGVPRTTVQSRCKSDKVYTVKAETLDKKFTAISIETIFDWIFKDKPSKVEKLRKVLAKNDCYFPPLDFDYLTIKTTTRSNNDIKTQFKLKIAQQIQGQLDYKCTVGKLDVYTSEEAVVVSHITSWKVALGQLLACTSDLSHHTKLLYLFGELPIKSTENGNLIFSICLNYRVTVILLK